MGSVLSRLAHSNGNVDVMAIENADDGKSRVVVGGWRSTGSFGVSRTGWKRWIRDNGALRALFAVLLCLCSMMWITPVGNAEDTTSGFTITDNVTDTENLLGSNVSEVTDAIKKTKKETGVTVRLLYLESFETKRKPARWASDLLESLNPAPNTVMLAVASSDGNLVVAVSSNSDKWLKKQSTVEALSDAAQKPLMQSTPNWVKSATGMMDQIAVEKKTSTSSKAVVIGVVCLVAALVLLVVLLVVFHVLREKGIIKRKVRKHAGVHARVPERAKPVKAWNAGARHPEDANREDAATAESPESKESRIPREPMIAAGDEVPKTVLEDGPSISKEDSESVQETSSERGEA